MAETEFIKIADAKNVLKGSFKGIIIKAGDLKSGTSNGRDWTKKIFTIQDESGDTDLVAWGDEVNNFKLGYKYEITNPWWKTYEGKVSVTVGNYGNSKVIGAAEAEETKPTGPQQSLDQGKDSPNATQPAQAKCPHGNPNIDRYKCTACMRDLIQGIMDELNTIKSKL
jgi:hypothetical protein